MLTSRSPFGSFQNRPEDVVRRILKMFSSDSLKNLALTNSSWSRHISDIIESSDYQEHWIQKMCFSEDVASFCLKAANLIKTTHGSNSEGVDLLEQFAKKTFSKSKSHEGAGLLLSGFFADQHEPADVKTVAAKVFDLCWNLDEAYFQSEIPAIIDFLQRSGRVAMAWINGNDSKHLDALAQRSLVLNRRLNALFRFECSEKMQTSVQRHLFDKTRAVLRGNVQRMVRFVFLLLSPVDEITGNEVNLSHFTREERRNCHTLLKMEPVAKFFKALLKTSRTPKDLDFVARVFVEFMKIPAPLVSSVLHVEPALLRLYLHDEHFNVYESETVSAVLLRTLMTLSHYDASEEQFEDLRRTLELVRRRCLTFENGRAHLKNLSKGVRKEINNCELLRLQTTDNKFWDIFHKVLLDK